MRRESPGGRVAAPWYMPSDGDDLHVLVGSDEIAGVTGVQAGRVRVCGGGDEQVDRAGRWLASSLNNGCRYLAVARGDSVVQRQSVKLTLQHAQAPKPLSAGAGIPAS